MCFISTYSLLKVNMSNTLENIYGILEDRNITKMCSGVFPNKNVFSFLGHDFFITMLALSHFLNMSITKFLLLL